MTAKAKELYYLAFSVQRLGDWNEDRQDDVERTVRQTIICGQLENDHTTDRLLEWFGV